jgi:hypothetical protein
MQNLLERMETQAAQESPVCVAQCPKSCMEMEVGVGRSVTGERGDVLWFSAVASGRPLTLVIDLGSKHVRTIQPLA